MAHDCDPRDDGLIPQPGEHRGIRGAITWSYKALMHPYPQHMYDVSKENLSVSPNVASFPHKYSSDKTDFSLIME